MRTHDQGESRKNQSRSYGRKRALPRFETESRDEVRVNRRRLSGDEDEFENRFDEEAERDWEGGRNEDEEEWRDERLGRGDRDVESHANRGRSRLVSEYEDEDDFLGRDEWENELRQNRERGRYADEYEGEGFRSPRVGREQGGVREARGSAGREHDRDLDRDRLGRFATEDQYREGAARRPRGGSVERSGRSPRDSEAVNRRAGASSRTKTPAGPSERPVGRASEKHPRGAMKKISHGRRAESGGRSQNKRGQRGRSRSPLH